MTFLQKENLIKINEDLRYKYQLEIPPVFLYGNSDINAFIDLEILLLDDFDFSNEELKKINAKKYFKISIEELKNSPENKSEPKDWGFGYSKESKNGKSAGIERSIRIKKFFLENINPNKHKNLIIKEKMNNSEELYGIAGDLITDFILITKEKDIKKFTEIIFNKLEKEMNLENNIIIRSLKKYYKINNNTNIEAFPFLIPTNITKEFIGSLGKEFEESIFNKFINENNINFNSKDDEKEAFKTNFKSSFSEKRDKWLKFKKKNEYNEFLKLEKQIEEIDFSNDFNFLKYRKNWEIDFFLSNPEVLEKLNLIRNSSFLRKNNGKIIIVNYFTRNKEIFIFNSNLNLKNSLIKKFSKSIFSSKKYSDFKISFIVTKSKMNSNIFDKIFKLKNKYKINIKYLNIDEYIIEEYQDYQEEIMYE